MASSWPEWMDERLSASMTCHGYCHHVPGVSAFFKPHNVPDKLEAGHLYLTAPILPTFVASFGHCIKMLMVPCSVLCGTRTRKLSAIA